MQTRRLHQLGQGANENGRVDANDDRLWVVDLGDGQLQIVQGPEALKALIVSHGLPRSARAYELSALPRTLGEIPEVDPVFPVFEAKPPAPQAAPVIEEVALAPVLETAAPQPAPAKAELEVAAPAAPPEIASAALPVPTTAAPPRKGSDDAEFSLLDRPFDDTEYFEDPPRGRWPRVVGTVAVVACLVGGGYKLSHSRDEVTAPVVATLPTVPTLPTLPTIPTPPTVPAPTVIAAVASPAPAQAQPTPAPSASPPPVAAPAQVEERLPDPPVPSTLPAAPSPSYSALVAEGRRLFDRGHSRKAQVLFEQALAAQPDGIDALVGLAYAQLDGGKMQDAIGSFKRALDEDGSQARAVFGLAESYRQQGNRSAALATFKRFLKLQPAGADADIARRLVEDLNTGG
jgi:hypothetical protein